MSAVASGTRAIVCNLLCRLTARHAIFLGVAAFLLAIFPMLMAAAVNTVDVDSIFGAVRSALPPMFQEMFGQELALTLTSRGLLVFAWNHPIVHALLAAVVILLATHALAGEIEAGTLELVLSQPVSRQTYFVTQVLFAAVVVFALVGCLLAGTALGVASYGLHATVPWPAFLPVAANLICLQLSFYGISLLFSALANESRRVTVTALLIVLISYLLQAVARIWQPLAFLLRYSLFEYYSPQRTVLLQEAPWNNVLVLSLVAALAGGMAWWQFMKRDIH